jgi:transcription-repair coupling factor (superfamily II helicase)
MNPTPLPDLDIGLRLTLGSVPDGFQPVLLAEIASKAAQNGRMVCYIAPDAEAAQTMARALHFAAPFTQIIEFPSWDCQPYDRASPNEAIIAQRLAALYQLSTAQVGKGLILLTTASAAMQMLPPVDEIRSRIISLKPGQMAKLENLITTLEHNGFHRSTTVREPGEYAVRGGILDLYPPTSIEPVRLDFFGDTLESIRGFDAETQRTTSTLKQLALTPTSEVVLNEQTIRNFRSNYLKSFGAATPDDQLYHGVSEGQRQHGMEHWLPLFYNNLNSLFDYLIPSVLVLDHQVERVMQERNAQIKDHYQTRLNPHETSLGSIPYKPVEPEKLYIAPSQFKALAGALPQLSLSPYTLVESFETGAVQLVDAREGRDFLPERKKENINIYDVLIAHINDKQKAGKRVIIGCWSEGSRDRLKQLLKDHGYGRVSDINSLQETEGLNVAVAGLAIAGFEKGFETPDLALISEQDILGDRFVRNKRKKKASDVLTDASTLTPGDFVVHVDHGIGQFSGLKTIVAAGAPRDCLELIYASGDKLYLPVENIELLTRYGSDEANATLDRLGGSAWQARKSKLKKRIRDMAEKLIAVAASRLMRTAPTMESAGSMYEEFAATFPYEETEDQMAAIEATLSDLNAGKPMDRLICGDVGFGKTEVALRAAFTAAAAGKQVAVVVPTTLLARQHYANFTSRFKGFPLRICQLSRLVPAKEQKLVREELKSGMADIVIGTHALLGSSVAFKDLALLIIDEEQHFGVAHKEKLKQLRANVHVLTLSATPIPRTLQLALTGVRELSLIATPPVDRLAVRSFVTPFDPMVVREALLREKYRGGQSFFVCPRIADLAESEAFLRESVPEVKLAVAHGQMPPTQLEDIMTAFYEGQFDVLLSTTIVESGLDVPRANTLIIHKAHLFGLAQLYQLRGRVGRAKSRAYAYFTTPTRQKLTAAAEKRLKVLQSLEGLGAGFTLASHDLDQRGAGNLLGEEQSGHIKEVGYELYQSMLEEAVATLKSGGFEETEEQWSPQISLGTAVLIPETYVQDLDLRLALYRRLSALEEQGDIEQFAAELIDRFGHYPEEVENLLQIVSIKVLCRKANVAKLDAGPKGIVVSLRDNRFANPNGLVAYIQRQGSLAKIKPDQKIVFSRDLPKPKDRAQAAYIMMGQLAKLAAEVK